MRIRKAALAAATLAIASLGGTAAMSAPASATYVPPPPGGCSNQAVARYSYIGVTVGRGSKEVLTSKEITGVGCYFRQSSRTAKVDFQWSAVGRLNEGQMRVQLRDCTAGTWAHQTIFAYTHGSRSNRGGMATKSWSLNPHHRYRLRIWGTGSYKRGVQGNYGGIGRFYAAAQNHKHWLAWGGTRCS